MFVETQTILFNETACAASEELPRKVKFDLKSEDNRRPLSFVTYYQVTRLELPRMRAALAGLLAQNETSLEEEINVVKTGIASWEEVLKQYHDTNALASEGGLPPLTKYFVNTTNIRPHCEQRRRMHKTNVRECTRCFGVADNEIISCSNQQCKRWTRQCKNFSQDCERVDLSEVERTSVMKEGYDYQCTSKKGVFPSPDPVLPDITQVCQDFDRDDYKYKCGLTDGGKECVDYESHIRKCDRIPDWEELPDDHPYWKVSFRMFLLVRAKESNLNNLNLFKFERFGSSNIRLQNSKVTL